MLEMVLEEGLGWGGAETESAATGGAARQEEVAAPGGSFTWTDGLGAGEKCGCCLAIRGRRLSSTSLPYADSHIVPSLDTRI